jgi:hypothetical protein
MSREIQNPRVDGAQTRVMQPPLPSDLAEQVRFFAGDSAEGVLWSDVFAHVRGGVANLRRALSERGAQSPR